MPINDNWRKLIPEQIINAPDFAGVYELAGILQDLLYIGHTESLARTIAEINDKKEREFPTVSFFRFHATQEHEKEYNELIEEYRQKHNALPPLNVQREKTSN
jgi:hypothetical protein